MLVEEGEEEEATMCSQVKDVFPSFNHAPSPRCCNEDGLVADVPNCTEWFTSECKKYGNHIS